MMELTARPHVRGRRIGEKVVLLTDCPQAVPLEEQGAQQKCCGHSGQRLPNRGVLGVHCLAVCCAHTSNSRSRVRPHYVHTD